jgi:mRNA turnover protein 4
MRNARLKDVRGKWKRSRFFLGKNKVMAKALGKTPEEEYRAGLANVSKLVSGTVGLLFTNQDVEYTTEWFANFGEVEYARAGNVATETVKLDKGPLPQFSHAIEPHLRSLGLPTSLQRGVVTLDKDFDVCTEGASLTAERARILKLFEMPMATFKVQLSHHWSADTGLTALDA